MISIEEVMWATQPPNINVAVAVDVAKLRMIGPSHMCVLRKKKVGI